MLESVGAWVIQVISTFGYAGIVLTMAIESALIPLPSEIIMPFSGYLASTGRFSLVGVALAGALGNLLGSLIAYWIGAWGNEQKVRELVRKHGKWILVSEEELDLAERLLLKYKDVVAFGSRLVPGIRTVISLPCGFVRMPLLRFAILTTVGSFLWSLFLAWIGFTLGENWETLGPYFRKLDALIVIVVLALLGLYVYYKVGRKRGVKVSDE